MVDRGQRRKGDAYYTPAWATRLFLAKEPFWRCHSIWEPCAGEGAMAKVLLENFPTENVIATDIDKTGWAVSADRKTEISEPPTDFLTSPNRADAIICNPPYSIFHHIILKAKRVADKKIAMLLPLSYLQGQTRYDELWMDRAFPLAKIYVFNRFFDLSLPMREDGKMWLGMQTYAWYVWDKEYDGEPVIRWIDCRDYVVSPGKRSKE